MIYKEIIESKNGLKLPVFTNNKPMHSKYNPENEASLFAKDNFSDFFIIIGIGGSYHISALLKQNPNSFIIAIEESKEDIDFLLQIPETQKCLNSKNIIFANFSNLKTTLLNNYSPYFYNKITILKHRSWTQENTKQTLEAETIIKETLNIISQDFSVQNHFGKLWHRNIISNFLNYEKIIKNQNQHLLNIQKNKTAAIIAAGPSLDNSITHLIKNRNNYYIITTDTAYGPLTKNKIIPDACITVDTQNISHSHYLNLFAPEKTLFIFDISSSNSSITHINKEKGNIYFVKNNHPLSNYIDQENTLLNLSSGSGTVTIAACDFANKIGFTKIKIFGADFSYGNGKPYAKGTYLEDLFNTNQTKIISTENQNSKLMFRTPLFPSENKKLINSKTSTVLESYKKTMEEWIFTNSYIQTPDDTGETLYKKSQDSTFNSLPQHSLYCEKNHNQIIYKDRIFSLITQIEASIIKYQENTFINKKETLQNNPSLTTYLPLIANLKKNNETMDFFSLVKLAHSLSKRYTYI